MTNCFELSNGYKIPSVGFGTWRLSQGQECEKALICALDAGYRHIDTAAAYGNEASVGKIIKETELNREDVFVTSKLWNTERGYDKTLRAFETTLSKLGTDYLDLYLIHWPAIELQFDNWKEINLSTWKALIQLYKDGRVKAIGVSNFMLKHIEPLMDSEIVPMVNQIEFHPGYMQNEVFDFCRKNSILVEAWSPLGCGRVLDNENLIRIASKYKKTVAQLCVRWCIQNLVVPLPKSVTPARISENFDVFDFEISRDDMNFINSMPVFGESGHYPDEVDF